MKEKKPKVKCTKQIRQYAIENRKNPTAAECIFERVLKELHISYETQLPIALMKGNKKVQYIADFVTKNVIFEIDGGYHNVNGQLCKDYEREQNLINLGGFKIIRFPNELMNEKGLTTVKRTIRNYVLNKTNFQRISFVKNGGFYQLVKVNSFKRTHNDFSNLYGNIINGIDVDNSMNSIIKMIKQNQLSSIEKYRVERLLVNN